MTLRNCFFLPFCITCLFFFLSCSQLSSCAIPSSKTISLMSWNTQLFFDPYENGSEYAEYIGPSSRWTVEKYRVRIDRLCEVILSAGAELGEGPKIGPAFVVLQEVENSAVVEDICNNLPSSARYEVAVFVPPESGTAFGTAVLSRFPVVKVTSHAVDSPGTRIRPLLHCEFSINGKPLHLFCVHWKSKAGSSDSSPIRLSQEKELYTQLKYLEKSDLNFVALCCGDFNQTEEEFTLMKEYWNPWSEQKEGGSYYYQGNWERIDHIFCSPVLHNGEGIEADGFRVLKDSNTITSGGIPARYELYSGKGYSDHLPVLIEITGFN